MLYRNVAAPETLVTRTSTVCLFIARSDFQALLTTCKVLKNAIASRFKLFSERRQQETVTIRALLREILAESEDRRKDLRGILETKPSMPNMKLFLRGSTSRDSKQSDQPNEAAPRRSASGRPEEDDEDDEPVENFSLEDDILQPPEPPSPTTAE